MNELLFLASIPATFACVLGFHRFFGKAGLFAWVALATVFANIEVIKCVTLFGLETTLGNVLFGSTFLATDILSEIYGKAAAKKAVWIGLAAICAFVALLQFSLAFAPSAGDFADAPMQTLFRTVPRVCLASVTLYFVANMLDVHLFHALRDRVPGHLWLRNNVATMTCQTGQAFFFCFAAFYGTFDARTCCEISVTTALVECLVAACDTPFLYWACRMTPPESAAETRNA